MTNIPKFGILNLNSKSHFQLRPTASGLAMAGHLSTAAEAYSYAKYSEKDEFIPKALLAPNRCWR